MKRLGILLVALAWLGAAALPAAGQQLAGDLQAALEYNRTRQASTWINPDTGGRGAVTPVRTFTGTAGQPCREFVTTIVIAGRDEQGYGTACRQPDGSWRIAATDRPRTVRVITTAPRVVYVPPPVAYPRYRTYDRYAYDPWYAPYGAWTYPRLSLSFGWFHSSGGHRGHHHRAWSHRGHHRGKWLHGGHHQKHGRFDGHRRGHRRGHR